MIHTKYEPRANRIPARVVVNPFIPSHSITAIAINKKQDCTLKRAIFCYLGEYEREKNNK